MVTPKENRVDLGHTNFLGVLSGAELKYSVCPDQKCPQMPQNPIWPPTAGLKCIYVHICWTKQGRNSNELCFCMLPYMGASNSIFSFELKCEGIT